MDADEMPHPDRSTFVTVVAWVFIALAGLATIITALQNVMLFAVFPLDEVRQHSPEDPHFQAMPAWARFMVTHGELWFLFCFAMSATTLVAAIGVLCRQNWARLLLVGVLLFGILWNVVVPFLTAGMMPTEQLGRADADFATMFLVMRVFTWIMALGAAVLFAWLTWRLCSPAVRAEFERL